jgi:hypothetical protein
VVEVVGHVVVTDAPRVSTCLYRGSRGCAHSERVVRRQGHSPSDEGVDRRGDGLSTVSDPEVVVAEIISYTRQRKPACAAGSRQQQEIAFN